MRQRLEEDRHTCPLWFNLELLDSESDVYDLRRLALRHGHPTQRVVKCKLVPDAGRARSSGRVGSLLYFRNVCVWKLTLRTCSIQCFPVGVTWSCHFARGTRR